MFKGLFVIINTLTKAQQEVEKKKTSLNAVYIEKNLPATKIKRTLAANSILKGVSIENSLLSKAEALERLFYTCKDL